MNLKTQPQQMLASIKELLTANNLTKLDLSELDEEQTDPVYVIWYDRHCDPNNDPVLKVFLDDDGLSLEVDARNFGNTIRLYEDDFADKIDWLTGIRDNIIEVLKNKALVVLDQQTRQVTNLVDRECQWQKDVKAFLIDTLRERGGRISFTPKTPHDEYPVTTTLYGDSDYPRIDISDIYLIGDTIVADGFEADEGLHKGRCGFRIENEHLSDAFSFIRHILNH